MILNADAFPANLRFAGAPVVWDVRALAPARTPFGRTLADIIGVFFEAHVPEKNGKLLYSVIV